MRKYLAIYKEFFSSALTEATTYKLHFILVIIMDLLFYGSTLLSVEIIYQQVDQIGVWSREEFMLFISFMLAIDHLHMAIISENFWNFSLLIRSGKLDFELLRPSGTLFTLFFRHIRVQTLLITPVPWGALIYFGQNLGLTWSQWLSLPLLIILGLTLLVSIEILLSMMMFVTVESFGINFLRMQLQQVSRWPDFIYRFKARIAFTFLIPVLLVGSAPMKILFHQDPLLQISLMIGAILLFWGLIRITWIKALTLYESASS
ncbi:ABC transporter permease [Pseudobacteriovorax antillogorgiicola]|uniref:ABC-2 type transport system permease protein n=1 Tax=Pseudobacteriovorax antillogorgiicola TaxID=1513793 RepID=A0A1Y6CG37_9BACT|nr:ABC-2 family transporter protein [Pseudobacteriovorax antillogorgiicola]TCS47334.1 ABC-2 type transport system permease protein [Pseudobacteriovorax antillogorgiicola]SMF63081.1 ABC-2 type transport system permease protein [Pseudobacteriovorax antillogorgiicola]